MIATAWASLVHLGQQGFMDITQKLMQVTLTYLVHDNDPLMLPLPRVTMWPST